MAIYFLTNISKFTLHNLTFNIESLVFIPFIQNINITAISLERIKNTKTDIEID